ncbi:MAG TPA: hypothetical protein VE173_13230, partial [Longimicrobiales bacterium]|nr:hypothetical protein [Longimicrobiales bacterium]
MRTRSEQLRDRYRRILAWSLGGAAAIHVAVFVLMPTFRAEPLGGLDVELDTATAVTGANASVEVLFGPPTIGEPDGSPWTAPRDRVLRAKRGVRLEPACTPLLREERTPRRGRVQLRVRPSGRVDVLDLAGSSGDLCADRVLREVAADLWYHWLPS